MIMIVKANKSKRFPEKLRKYFQIRHERGVGIPQQQNEQFGRRAEPLIFLVCTDTGCACCYEVTSCQEQKQDHKIFFQA